MNGINQSINQSINQWTDRTTKVMMALIVTNKVAVDKHFQIPVGLHNNSSSTDHSRSRKGAEFKFTSSVKIVCVTRLAVLLFLSSAATGSAPRHAISISCWGRRSSSTSLQSRRKSYTIWTLKCQFTDELRKYQRASMTSSRLLLCQSINQSTVRCSSEYQCAGPYLISLCGRFHVHRIHIPRFLLRASGAPTINCFSVQIIDEQLTEHAKKIGKQSKILKSLVRCVVYEQEGGESSWTVRAGLGKCKQTDSGSVTRHLNRPGSSKFSHQSSHPKLYPQNKMSSTRRTYFNTFSPFLIAMHAPPYFTGSLISSDHEYQPGENLCLLC